MWPKESPVNKPYALDWDEKEVVQVDEVTLCVGMTAYPEVMKNAARDIGKPVIKILAKEMGNAAIPHPSNGQILRSEVSQLLLQLRDKFKIKKVHLLICASNAVCVFIGQAYDLYHPNVLVYDFEEDSMAPKLLIKNSEKGKPMVSLP